MDEFETALRLVANTGESTFVGPIDPSRVRDAEIFLEVEFPPSYRRFLTELGAGNIAHREFYGIVPGGLEVPSVPNGIWVTSYARRELSLLSTLVVVGDTGYGQFYVLKTASISVQGECPVAISEIGSTTPEADLDDVAPDFGSFFLAGVREALGLDE